jgi:TonB family protein
MALRPRIRLGLVGDPRQGDALTDSDEPDDERDIRISLSVLASTLSAHGEVLLSADLALDLLLNRLAEQARLATNTTGAAIALRRGDEIVCRATTGATAPDLGIRLNMASGLSAACVQTGKVQSCDDTETDLRVDSIACRHLGVRSILIVPVLQEQELVGVFEVFSPQPRAFGDGDVQALNALSRRAVDSIARSAEAVARSRPGPFPLAVPAALPAPARVPLTPRRRDPWTSVLTVVVLALAMLLGWMLGRDGWHRTLRTMKTKSAPARIDRQLATPVSTPPIVKSRQAPAGTENPTTRASSGDLVVYQDGKVIYRAKSWQAGGEPGYAGNLPAGKIPEVAPVLLPANVAERYLVQRIEPAYPDFSREQHVQGQVLLQATVGADGTVEKLAVISGDPQLAIAAGAAVRQWRFRPLLKAGRPIEFQTQIAVDFRLP